MSSFAIAPGRLMKQPEFVAFRDHLLQQCISIHSERAAKYATPGNAFADLRASEEGGVTAPQAAYIHLGKHYRAVGCIVAQMACGEAPTDAPAHRCSSGDRLPGLRHLSAAALLRDCEVLSSPPRGLFYFV